MQQESAVHCAYEQTSHLLGHGPVRGRATHLARGAWCVSGRAGHEELSGTQCTWWKCHEVTGLDIKHLVYMPIGHMVLKIDVPRKIFTCPANICTSPVKLMDTAGKIMTCPDLKITCPVGHVTTKVYVPWDKIYMPRACGHTLMSSPEWAVRLVDEQASHLLGHGPARVRATHQWRHKPNGGNLAVSFMAQLACSVSSKGKSSCSLCRWAGLSPTGTWACRDEGYPSCRLCRVVIVQVAIMSWVNGVHCKVAWKAVPCTEEQASCPLGKWGQTTRQRVMLRSYSDYKS